MWYVVKESPAQVQNFRSQEEERGMEGGAMAMPFLRPTHRFVCVQETKKFRLGVG